MSQTVQHPRTTAEVAKRFQELAEQNKWFEIQDELFAPDVCSIEPANASYLENAIGKGEVRKKGEAWVSRIESLHDSNTSELLVAEKHFAVKRMVDITVNGIGRIRIDQIMLYTVRDGLIIEERFFY